jgi:cullin 3
MTMSDEFIESNWKLLKSVTQEILTTKSTSKDPEELYRTACALVLHKKGERLYNGLKEVVTEHLQQKVRQDVMQVLNNNFPQTLNQAWIDYQTSMVMIRDIFMYMDRVYAPQNNVENIHDLGIRIFRDEIVRHEPITNHLRETLRMNQQNGEDIETCQMLMNL